MDQQMKRGFIEAGVLAVLTSRESYGYQIIHDMPPALAITESTLYPVLKRLEAAACVTTRSAEHNGRLRKYYRITDEGRDRLAAFMRERAEVESVYAFIEQKTRGGIAGESARPNAGPGADSDKNDGRTPLADAKISAASDASRSESPSNLPTK